MDAKYIVRLEFTASFKDVELENLKSNTEYANDIAQMICDEIATAGGVGSYDIFESSIKCD